MGTESLRVIGCIFAENGPLEGGIESSFWVPAGVLRVISCVILTYTRTFSNREPIPFSKAHALSYTHSKVGNDQMHIRGRNDLWKVNFKRVCEKPAGVLMVIWSGFFALIRSFSKGAPHHFPKAHALRYGHRKFESDWMYIRGKWALRRWHWS